MISSHFTRTRSWVAPWILACALLVAGTSRAAACNPIVRFTGLGPADEPIRQAIAQSGGMAWLEGERPDLEITLRVAKTTQGRAPSSSEQWCVSAQAFSYGEPVLLLSKAVCASGDSHAIELSPPSNRALRERIGAPIVAAIGQWASARRSLEIANLATDADLVVGTVTRKLRAVPKLTVGCLPRDDAKLKYGECELDVPEARTEVVVPPAREIRLALGNLAGSFKVPVSLNARTEFTLVPVSGAEGRVFRFDCGGDPRLELVSSELAPALMSSPPSATGWTWSVKSVEAVAMIAVGASGGKASPSTLAVQLVIPWWRTWPAQIAGVVAGVAAFARGIEAIMKLVNRKKSAKPDEKAAETSDEESGEPSG